MRIESLNLGRDALPHVRADRQVGPTLVHGEATVPAGLTCVLAHTRYLRAIHGGKNKNDRIDSEKLAHLLRASLIPQAYAYPADKRPLRALLRQRTYFVWQRADLLARVQSVQLAHNRPTHKQTRPNRDPREQLLLADAPNPLRQLSRQARASADSIESHTGVWPDSSRDSDPDRVRDHIRN